jgi:hypothetical protein
MSFWDSIKNRFDNKDDIEFIDFMENPARHELTRIKLTSEVSPHFKEDQIREHGEFHFRKCPGMFDYSRMGYIMPAWNDMEFIFNKAGIAGVIGSPDSQRKMPLDIAHFNPTHSYNLVPPNEDGSPTKFFNLTSPWKVRTKPHIHMLIVPAFFHNANLRDFHIMPGVIEYGNGFNTLNFILSFKKYGTYRISAGDPLYQIIPFAGNNFTASYGLNSDYNSKINDMEWFVGVNNFYRKFHHVKKKFKLRKETGK